MWIIALSASKGDLEAVSSMEGSLKMRMVFGGGFVFVYKSQRIPSNIDSVHHLKSRHWVISFTRHC